MSNDADKSIFVDAWAQTLIKMWQGKIMSLDVYDTGVLYESFLHTVKKSGSGELQKVELYYKTYGLYVALGVGRNSDQYKREKKNWFFGVFHREIMKLREYMQFRYGQEASGIISAIWSQTFDNATSSIKKSMETLRNDLYRDSIKKGLNPSWTDYLKTS